MPAAAVAYPSPPELIPAEGRLWCQLIERRCGLHFPESQWHYLRRRLWERMKTSGLPTYSHYYERLAAAGGQSEEWRLLEEELLNPETSFFRHQPSFDSLAALLASRRGDGKPRELWSAGCSTGEEAYSLAMTSAVAGGATAVTGTDLNRGALARARAGIFPARQVAAVPPVWRSRFLRETSLGGSWEATAPLRSLVKFQAVHLLDSGTYPKREFDVIFCFNVLIYFRPVTRQEVAASLLGRLKPGGHLFLAPGEAAGLIMTGATPVRVEGTRIWRREE
jgi:type IV pilus assembly protein PilK